MMEFQWTISLGHVLGTGTLLLVGTTVYLLHMWRYRGRISALEREVLDLRASIHRLHILLNLQDEVGPDD